MTEATEHAEITSIIKVEHNDKHSFLVDKIHPQNSLVAAKTLFLLSSITLITLFFFFFFFTKYLDVFNCATFFHFTFISLILFFTTHL